MKQFGVLRLVNCFFILSEFDFTLVYHIFSYFVDKTKCSTGDPGEKPQGGGVFIWASLDEFLK